MDKNVVDDSYIDEFIAKYPDRVLVVDGTNSLLHQRLYGNSQQIVPLIDFAEEE